MSATSASPAPGPAIEAFKPSSALHLLLRIPLNDLLFCLCELSRQIHDPNSEDRKGGSLLIAVFDPVAKTSSELTISFGEPDPAKLSGTTFHVGKKFHSLRKFHPSGQRNVFCSGQIAHITDKENNDNNLYPGCMAFFFPDGTIAYIGISGWKAEADEACVYYAAKHLGLPLPANYRNVLGSEALKAFELGELIFDTHFEGVQAPLPNDAIPPFDAGYQEWQIGLMNAAAEGL